METTEKAYLTKRVVERATRKGMRQAAQKTMNVIGYIVVARDGWLMKEFPNGSTQKIKPIDSAEDIGPIILD